MDGWSRIIDVLKASGWQATGIAIASALFLAADRYDHIPPLDPWMVQVTVAVLLVSGCLAIAAIGSGTVALTAGVRKSIKVWLAKRRAKAKVRSEIAHMTDRERNIFAYLIAKNQKTFTCMSDGGYASPLIARGLIWQIGQRGQHFDFDKCVFSVPDHVWEVIQERRPEFPYTPKFSDGRPRVEVEPWHIPWQVR